MVVWIARASLVSLLVHKASASASVIAATVDLDGSPSELNDGFYPRNVVERGGNRAAYPGQYQSPSFGGGFAPSGGGNLFNPTYNGGAPAYQRPAYSPVVIPLVDVTRYWKLWGLQHSLCDTVSSTLEEQNIRELTSQQATQIGRALERSTQVYMGYHQNMVPELANDHDQMAVEARLWLGHDQFDRDLSDCWSNLSVISPELQTALHETVHDSFARSLCLPFDNYMACRELLQLPKNSIRRFKDQMKLMREEAALLLKRLGRPTRYSYYKNQFYYGGRDSNVWLDAGDPRLNTSNMAVAVLLTSVIMWVCLAI